MSKNLSMENFAPGKQEEKVHHENHYKSQGLFPGHTRKQVFVFCCFNNNNNLRNSKLYFLINSNYLNKME
jgi:hypothetical protein